MLARERLLDRLLALAEPVERDIELILVDRSEAEHVAQARCRGERIEHAGGGQLGGWRNEPRHDHGDDEITATIAGRPEHTVESRSVPSTAATLPCGNARRTMMLS